MLSSARKPNEIEIDSKEWAAREKRGRRSCDFGILQMMKIFLRYKLVVKTKIVKDKKVFKSEL